jgi:secreted trypsin-like serine protease
MLVVLIAALLPAGTWAHIHARSKRHRDWRPHAVRHRVHAHRRDRAHAAIVGGHLARNGQFPWVARVVARRGRFADACSGTVVATQLVLTAGHCVEDDRNGMPLQAGDFEVKTAAYSTRPTKRWSRVSRVLVYPGFDRTSGIGDAALLVLSTPAAVPPIQFADEAVAWPAGTRALMTGWGRTGEARRRMDPRFLRWARTVVQSPEWCAAHLRDFSTRHQLCTMNAPMDDTAGCSGDSGGPLLVKRAGETIEIGVLDGSVVRRSKVLTCLTTEPTVYASSSLLSRWVHEWIERLTSLPVTISEAPPTTQTAPSPQAPPAIPAVSATPARATPHARIRAGSSHARARRLRAKRRTRNRRYSRHRGHTQRRLR